MTNQKPIESRLGVRIMPKKGVLDPQSLAVEQALREHLGFEDLKGLSIGRLVTIELVPKTNRKQALSDLKKIVTRPELGLITPLIEDHEVFITEEDPEG